MPTGLQRGRVALEPHSAEWEHSARTVMDLLKGALGDVLVDVQHVGSTSIRDILAKPIIDLAAGVTGFEELLARNDALNAQGIVWRGQDHPGQHLYVCGDSSRDIRTHHIHAVLYGGQAWTDYLNFRDYLSTHAEDAREYSLLKESLARKYPDNRALYTAGKREFISEILRKAAVWRSSLPPEPG